MSASFNICIPARYQSTRLPGKPLIKLKGKELVLWAIESASQLGAKSMVVATDDKRIFDFVASKNHPVIMTSNEHQSGTDRIAECAEIMGWQDDELVLNYQGDEPMIPRSNVLAALNLFSQLPNISIATLFQTIKNIEDVFNPNVVKVVTDRHNRAMYFSRAPIPWDRDSFPSHPNSVPESVTYKQHIGLYAYKVSFLKTFSQLKPSPIELTESLEQMRALESGHMIGITECIEPMPHGIDTPEDVDVFNHS